MSAMARRIYQIHLKEYGEMHYAHKLLERKWPNVVGYNRLTIPCWLCVTLVSAEITAVDIRCMHSTCIRATSHNTPIQDGSNNSNNNKTASKEPTALLI